MTSTYRSSRRFPSDYKFVVRGVSASFQQQLQFQEVSAPAGASMTCADTAGLVRVNTDTLPNKEFLSRLLNLIGPARRSSSLVLCCKPRYHTVLPSGSTLLHGRKENQSAYCRKTPS